MMARAEYEDGYLGNFLDNAGVRSALDKPGANLAFPPEMTVGGLF